MGNGGNGRRLHPRVRESPADFRNKWRHDYPEEMIGTASSIFDQVAEALSARKTAKK